jgi:hypothetical protein
VGIFFVLTNCGLKRAVARAGTVHAWLAAVVLPWGRSRRLAGPLASTRLFLCFEFGLVAQANSRFAHSITSSARARRAGGI